MEFNTLTFIFLLLPISVFLVYLSKSSLVRNIIILGFSIVFYSWYSYYFLIGYFVLIVLAYYAAKTIETIKAKKTILILYCSLLICVLGYFKYINFIISSINQILSNDYTLLNIIAPLGISFFTFTTLAYIFDVYYGKIKAEKSLFKFIVYLSFFPTFISGPILRYEQIKNDLDVKENNINSICDGFRMFIMGLGKKVIIANNLALITSIAFDNDLNSIPMSIALLSAISYSLQIYFDFSGYSDMAIGIGKMLGFNHIKANFNYPYNSTSISEFWRRWHISLGSFFRDYVYIPLGGNRVKTFRYIINIFIVWFLTGLWHGANLTFILWGLYFGVILIFEKYFILNVLKKLPKFISRIYTLGLILISWIIFNSTSINSLYSYLKALLRFNLKVDYTYYMNLDIVYLWPILLIALLLAFGFGINIYDKINKTKYGFINDIYLILILIISIVLIVNGSYSPTIYFNF